MTPDRDADEVRPRVLQAIITSAGASSNGMVPLGGISLDLQKGGLRAEEVERGLAALEADGLIEAAPGGGSMLKLTAKGADHSS